ncbi:SDR family NAD(P)-dependent oxidoreductase [Phyllobacterium sp. 0TCS1.6C]|uniref:SDR family NAD(P)-dependent oxidoreductase n=1 Tax=unclassified Phyllobacterium TaxID=2638441 RepID=UPI002264526B|nr:MULTISPECIES: SDR family NAD(P)-dependent oxidoreductase [unclassified Phyllobacterium]MCX8279082.1 SDR family NAD(P)-dependent oxidoreductase [Phyllobacterium sp. 0TCS1.6C]MCX8293866.1 SDR family NAD(P)-dependent oxidoreductase [Phyllobacterium sp. 0TCS1.6A]
MIIVTGATHGIGRACVETLARVGEQVLATGRDVAAGAELADANSSVTFVSGDVSMEIDCKNIVDQALEMGGGRLSGLVNNAGMSKRIAFAEATQADWDEVLAVNARSAFLFTRYALDGLRKGKGSVVNVASIAGKTGEEGLAVYCASKAAVIGMTKALALEFGEEVRFNAVCPGQIATRMMKKIIADPLRKKQLELRIPANRFGTPEEVADVVAWLLSDHSSYVNGTVITVDGGETAGLRTPRIAEVTN